MQVAALRIFREGHVEDMGHAHRTCEKYHQQGAGRVVVQGIGQARAHTRILQQPLFQLTKATEDTINGGK